VKGPACPGKRAPPEGKAPRDAWVSSEASQRDGCAGAPISLGSAPFFRAPAVFSAGAP
jgi:hypothetical protein